MDQQPIWPDMHIDQDAWAEARQALGDDAPLQELLARAQSIKVGDRLDLK
jgi:hypothetical protein